MGYLGMRKIANTSELLSELKGLLAYAQGSRPSRRHISAALRDLGVRTAGADENKPILALVRTLQLRFIDAIGQELSENLETLHRSLDMESGSWDYGTPKLSGDSGSIRVWNKDTPTITTKRGNQIVGNLLVKVDFDFGSDTVRVELEHDNQSKIFGQNYAASKAPPYEIAWDCVHSWKMLLLN